MGFGRVATGLSQAMNSKLSGKATCCIERWADGEIALVCIVYLCLSTYFTLMLDTAKNKYAHWERIRSQMFLMCVVNPLIVASIAVHVVMWVENSFNLI